MFLTWGSLQALSKTSNNEKIYNSGKKTQFSQLAVDFAGRIPFFGSSDDCAEFLLLWMNPHKAAHGNYTQGISTAEFNTFFYKKTVNGMLHPLQGEGESYEEYFEQYRSCSFAYTIREGDKIIPCGFSLNYRLDRPDQWILFSLKNTHLPSEKRKQEDLQIITSFRPEFPRKVAGCFVREISDISAVADSIGVDLLSDYLKRIINEDGMLHLNAGVIKLFTRSINVSKELLNNLYADFKDKDVEAAAKRMHDFKEQAPDFLDSKDLLAIFAAEENRAKILESEALQRIHRYEATALPRQIALCMDKDSLVYKTLSNVELVPELKDARLQLGFILLLEEFELLEHYDELFKENPSFYKLAVLQQQKGILKACLASNAGRGVLTLLLQHSRGSLQELIPLLERQPLPAFDNLFENMQSFSKLSFSSTEYFVIYNVLMRRPELSREEAGSLAVALRDLPADWQALIPKERLADCLVALATFENGIPKILGNEALCRIQEYKASVSSRQIPFCMDEKSGLYARLGAVELSANDTDARLQLDFILLLDELNRLKEYELLLKKEPSFYKLAVLKYQKDLLRACLDNDSGIGILTLFVRNSPASISQLALRLKQNSSSLDALLERMNGVVALSSAKEYFLVYSLLLGRAELKHQELCDFIKALPALPQGWQTLISRETLADWLIAQDSCSLHEFSSLATGMQTVLAKMEALASLDKSRTVPNAVKRLLGEKCLANPADDLLAVASVCGSREHIELLYVLAELGVKREELPAIMQNPALTRMSTWLIELNLQASIPLLLAEQQLIEKIKDWDKAWQQACLLLFAQAQIGHDKLEWLKTNLQNDPELASLILQAYAADFSPLQLNNLAFIPEYRSAIRFLNLCQCDYQAGQLTEPCYQFLAAIAAWTQDSDKLENAEFKRYLKNYLTSVLDYFESGVLVHLEPVEAFPERWANSLQALVGRLQAVLEIKALNLPEPVVSMLLLPDYQAVLPYLRDLKLLSRERILWLVSDGVRCQLLKEIARLDNPDWQKASLILLPQGPLECSEWLQLLERFKAEGNLANLLCRLHHQGCSANKLKDIPFDLNLYQSLELLSSFGLDIDFDKLTKLVCQMFAGLYLFHKKNPQPLNGYFAQALSFLGSNLPLPSVNDWLDVSEQLLLSQPEEKEEIKKEIQELVFNHLYVLNVAETANRAEELVFNHPDRIRRMSVFIGEPIQGKRIENTPPLDFNKQTVKKLDSVSDELYENASTFFDEIPDKARTLIPFHLLLTEPLILQALKQIHQISPESLEDKAVTELACNSEAKGHDFRCLLQSLHTEKNYSENIVNFLASGINSRREISSKELKQEVNPEIRRLSVVLDRRLLLINRLRALDLGDEYESSM